MTQTHAHIPQVLLLVGTAIVLAVCVKVALDRLRVPTLLGYIVLGLLLHQADVRWNFLRTQGREILAFLEQLGVFCLLFRVGLESKLGGLLRELRRASVVWVGNVGLSATLGYLAAHYILELPAITSLFIAVALTATSVGMSIREWQDRGVLESRDGQLLLDVVEMDDLSAVVMMGVLVTVAPYLRHDAQHDLVLSFTLRLFLASGIKFFLFGGFCLLFARFAEPVITKIVAGRAGAPTLLLLVLGIGFLLTAFGTWLGFSVAIGAFFAGMVFSREPRAHDIDISFGQIFELFVPFLFIGIGLNLNAIAFIPATGVTVVLFVAAVLGKVLGGALTAWGSTDGRTALLLGVSLVPRAEIALLIMLQGHALGHWAVPDYIFSAMTVACGLTWLVTPFALRMLFPAHQAAYQPQ